MALGHSPERSPVFGGALTFRGIVDFGLFIASILFTLSLLGSRALGAVCLAPRFWDIPQLTTKLYAQGCRTQSQRFTTRRWDQKGDPAGVPQWDGGRPPGLQPDRNVILALRFRALAFDARDAGLSDRSDTSVHNGRPGRRFGRLDGCDRCETRRTWWGNRWEAWSPRSWRCGTRIG